MSSYSLHVAEHTICAGSNRVKPCSHAFVCGSACAEFIHAQLGHDMQQRSNSGVMRCDDPTSVGNNHHNKTCKCALTHPPCGPERCKCCKCASGVSCHSAPCIICNNYQVSRSGTSKARHRSKSGQSLRESLRKKLRGAQCCLKNPRVMMAIHETL